MTPGNRWPTTPGSPSARCTSGASVVPRVQTDPVLLVEVVTTSENVAATRSRTRKTALLADLIGRLEPNEVVAVIGLLVAAPHQGRLGVGWSTPAGSRPARPGRPN